MPSSPNKKRKLEEELPPPLLPQAAIPTTAVVVPNTTTKTIVDEATTAELSARIAKAKAAAGPILLDPVTMDYSTSQTANADIHHLTLRQLEHETLRMQARLKAVRERIVYLMASKKASKVRKRCSSEGCTNVAQKGGICKKHGAPYTKKKCSAEGCNNVAQRKGVCFSHGATYIMCRIEGCKNKVQQGGLCCRHGAKVKRCSKAGCRNVAQKDGLCMGCSTKHYKRVEKEQQQQKHEGQLQEQYEQHVTEEGK